MRQKGKGKSRIANSKQISLKTDGFHNPKSKSMKSDATLFGLIFLIASVHKAGLYMRPEQILCVSK